jgi:uncharacterized membrane protein
MRARRESVRGYLNGALWVVPAVFALLALAVGSLLSMVNFGPASALYPLLFQGSADDARKVLLTIVAASLSVTAVILGLTVVALRMASSQYSPRLLRTFLRDRSTQVVLGIFVGTFVYSAAGLYTVGVHAGARTADYPRLAVTVALGLSIACVGALVFFVDHLARSLQIDTVMATIGQQTAAVIAAQPPGIGRNAGQDGAQPPGWAVAIPAIRSGYVQKHPPGTDLTDGTPAGSQPADRARDRRVRHRRDTPGLGLAGLP